MLLLVVNLVQPDETIGMVNTKVHWAREKLSMDLNMCSVEVVFHHDQTMELEYRQVQ